MGDLGWPAPTLRPDPRPAVGLLREILLSAADARQPATLVTLGPLTNVAALFSAEPGVAGGLREIIVMGGAFGPEEEARKDFNIRHDPEAAASTLEAAGRFGIPVTMYTFDVFFEPRVSRGEAARLAAVGGHSPAELAGRLLAFHCNRFGADEATIGDAGAVCAVLDPARRSRRGTAAQRRPDRPTGSDVRRPTVPEPRGSRSPWVSTALGMPACGWRRSADGPRRRVRVDQRRPRRRGGSSSAAGGDGAGPRQGPTARRRQGRQPGGGCGGGRGRCGHGRRARRRRGRPGVCRAAGPAGHRVPLAGL